MSMPSLRPYPAELVRFEDSGHGLFYEERDKLTDKLLDIAG